MSSNFLRTSVLALAALLVAGIVPASQYAAATHATLAANGPGGGGGTGDPAPPCGSDCIAHAL